jgi:hypothetical protein
MFGICERCGSEKNIEKHHVRQQKDDGGDIDINIQPLCKGCHDFKHAYKIIKAEIVLYSENQPERLKLLRHRLEVLIAFNTPELIKERGTYKSYWDDLSTHNSLPRRITIKSLKTKEIFKQLELLGLSKK